MHIQEPERVLLDEGQTNAVLTLQLAPSSGLPVTVYFETTNGMATSGLDFTPTNGFVVFAPGETNQTIAIPVLGEALSESNETFFVRFSVPTNAVIADGLGQITVVDDDPLPMVQFVSPVASVSEPLVDTTNAELLVSLSAPSGRTVSVKYTTTSDTARAGADFVAKSGSVVFTPGVTNLPVLISIKSDVEPELHEIFSVDLDMPVNATLFIPRARCTIVITSQLEPVLVASAIPMLEAESVNGGVRLRFVSAPGERYSIERNEDLSDPAGWAPLGGDAKIFGTGTMIEIIDAETGKRPRGFYRLRRLTD